MSKLYQDNQDLAAKQDNTDATGETEDTKSDLYYNKENGKLELRS
jgi:hypothetical protein